MRLLVKISGEEFKSEAHAIDMSRVAMYAKEIVAAAQSGNQIGVVVGGGNIFRGRSADLGQMTRAKADFMGMEATIENGRALTEAINTAGGHAHMFSAISAADTDMYSAEATELSLEKGEVCIFVGGSGQTHVTTDTAAALRAVQMDAECMVKITKVDGVYDADPVSHPTAKKFDHITYGDAIAKQLHVMDLSALGLASEYHLPIVVTTFASGVLSQIAKGEKIGTRVSD